MRLVKYLTLILSLFIIAVLFVTGCSIPTPTIKFTTPTFTASTPKTSSSTSTSAPVTTSSPTVSTPPVSATSTVIPTPAYPATEVDIYSKGAPWDYQDPADNVMSPNVLGFAWNLNEDPDAVRWAHDHGAKFISEVSLWNHDSWKTLGDLPESLKTAYNTSFDGDPLFTQDMVYLNTNDPAFQQWLSDFMKGQIDQGADGFVFDETSGSADAMYMGGGLDTYSLEGFGEYLAGRYSASELQLKGISTTAGFNYRQYIIDKGLTAKYKQGDLWNITFGPDYYDFLKARATALVTRLTGEALDYAASQGKSLLITANADPIYPEPAPGFNRLLNYYTFEHPFLHNTWRNDPGYKNFDYGVPVMPKIKYAISQGQKAVVLMGISDYGDLSGKGLTAGTELVLHFFAETYAGLGFFCYFDLEQPFIGMQFVADHPTLRPYYAFLREHPEVFNGLSFKPDTAVIVPPVARSIDLGPIDAVQGTSFVLSQLNIPYDVINTGHIFDYKVIIADGYAWSDEQLAKLLDYARSGGTVIAMDGRFASRNENYQEVTRPEIAALKTEGTHALGAGKFIFFNENVGWLYWAKRDAASFNSIKNAVTQVVTPNSAPEGVQLLPYTGDDKMVIHILNYNYAGNEFVTQKNVAVSVQIPEGFTAEGKTLTLLSPDGNAGMTLPYSVEGNQLKFIVPDLYIWSAAVIQ